MSESSVKKKNRNTRNKRRIKYECQLLCKNKIKKEIKKEKGKR